MATTIVKTAMLRLVAGMGSAVTRLDEKADRMIDLLSIHTAPRHYAHLLNACGYLAAHYRQANDPGRSRMWLQVYGGLQARFAD